MSGLWMWSVVAVNDSIKIMVAMVLQNWLDVVNGYKSEITEEINN